MQNIFAALKLSATASALALCVGLAAVPAQAAEFIGDTTGGPTFNRPSSLTTLTGAAINPAYEVTAFTVDAAGSFNFALNSNTAGYNPYFLLYQNSFDPSDQLTNLLALNDDKPFSFNSALSFGLDVGTSYFAVATGFLNDDFGAYTLTIDGPGNVIAAGPGAVPEPATWAMLILGFGLIGGALRRRKANVRTSVSYA